MPVITVEQYCKEFEPTIPLDECLERAARADAQFVERSDLVSDLCRIHGRAYCDAAIGCLSSSSEESFASCLDYARQQVERDYETAIAWGVGVILALFSVAIFWWRRPLGRFLRRVSQRIGAPGAP